MRIISQDNSIDLPYDRFVISVNMQNQGEIIAWTGNHISDDECIVMAVYSTKEKAEKAMEMLHREHQYNLELFVTNGHGSDQPEFIFKFPADEDVEV